MSVEGVCLVIRMYLLWLPAFKCKIGNKSFRARKNVPGVNLGVLFRLLL